MPGLDVLRGIAILGVVTYHASATLPKAILQGFPELQWLQRGFEFGRYGVHLFFVLSGFLISGILLDSKEGSSYYKDFYVRRVLRILPAYLLMVAVLRFSRTISSRYVIVCLFYLCNMSKLLGTPNEYGPLWSLSVEEQFYAVWPVCVRHLRQARLLLTCWLIIFGAPILRYLLQFAPPALSDIHYKTWVVADFFAAGALLAVYVRSEVSPTRLRNSSLILIGCGVLSLLLQGLVLVHYLGPKAASAIELSPFVVLFSGMLLFSFCYPQITKPVLGRLLGLLGEISYGLYLVHQFIFSRVQVVSRTLEIGHPRFGILLSVALELVLAFVVALISRRTVEAWFLRLKPKRRSSLA